jgi:hypothetical protein
MLPDDVLKIFDFYVDEELNGTEWIKLAHDVASICDSFVRTEHP